MNERRIFERLIDICQVASTSSALMKALGRLAKSAGFERYAYFRAHPSDHRIFTNYPSEWQRRYVARSYMTIDPVVATARRGTHVFRWSIDEIRSRVAPEIRRFYTEAADFDLKSGLSVSVSAGFGRCAILTFASSSHWRRDNCLVGETSALGITAAALMHSRVEQVGARAHGAQPATLTANEVACLRWSADGKTMVEIAAILEMTYSGVRHHIDVAKVKFGVVTLKQAIAVATRRGLI